MIGHRPSRSVNINCDSADEAGSAQLPKAHVDRVKRSLLKHLDASLIFPDRVVADLAKIRPHPGAYSTPYLSARQRKIRRRVVPARRSFKGDVDDCPCRSYR